MSLDPPSITVRPLCSDKSITISFSAPANTGGFPIQSYYIANISTGTGVLAVPQSNTFYTYRGLTNGQTYTPSIYYLNTNSVSSQKVFYRSVQPGVQSEPPFYNTVVPIAPSTAISVVITPSNVGSAKAKWLLTTLINPTTGAQQVATEYPNIDPTKQQFKYLKDLESPWYRWYAQAANDAGKSYQPPGLSTLNYYNFPQQYNDSSSTLQFWFDASMMTKYTNNNSLFFNPGTLSNYAIPTSYTFYSSGNTVSQFEFPNVNKYAIRLGYPFGTIICPEITAENQLSNEAFSLFYVGKQEASPITAEANKVLQSRWNESQYIGFGDSVQRVCQMDDTPFVPSGIPSDFTHNIVSLTRNGTTGCVSFGWNGSTISTSDISLPTLNDISFSQTVYSAASLAELIYYSKELDTSEKQSMEGYLAWKWGLNSNLPPDHPYYSSPP